MQLYKPNSKKTGSACSWSFNSSHKKTLEDGRTVGGLYSVYTQLIKQTSWNDQTKRGSFKGGDKINLKFSVWEVGEMINTFKNYGECKFFHKSEDTSSQISIKYAEDRNQFALSVSQGDKKFFLPISIGESNAIIIWLENALIHIFDGQHSEQKKLIEGKYPTKKPSPKNISSDNEDDDNPF